MKLKEFKKPKPMMTIRLTLAEREEIKAAAFESGIPAQQFCLQAILQIARLKTNRWAQNNQTK